MTEETRPCRECGALVILSKTAQHANEHLALSEALGYLIDIVKLQDAQIADLYRRLNGERPA